MTRYRHGGNLGDAIYSLAAVRDLCQRSGEKAEYWLLPNQYALYDKSFKHPLGCIKMSAGYAASLVPLLELQDYITAAGVCDEEFPIDVDLDMFRQTGFDFAHGSIARWYNLAFLCNPDLSKPWIQAPTDPQYKDLIVVNRTLRYRNPWVSYSFLRGKTDLAFVGLTEEFNDFRKAVGPGAIRIEVKDYLELATILTSCKLAIGNQSSFFALAESLGCTRMVEICPVCPNCIPTCNANGWEFYGQEMLEKIFHYLMAQEKPRPV